MEKLKTLILSVLIVSSFILTWKIWFDKELWSYGYNSFVNFTFINWLETAIDNMPWKDAPDAEGSLYGSKMYYPSKIVVSLGATKLVYAQGKPYEDLYNMLKQPLSALMSSTAVSRYKVIEGTQEWSDALKQKCFYIDYGVEYSTKILSQILKSSDNPILSNYLPYIGDVIIAPLDNVFTEINIYVRNPKDNTIVLAYVKFDKTQLNAQLSQSAATQQPKYSFSFERGFDKKTAGNVLLDSYVLIAEGDSAAVHQELKELKISPPKIDNHNKILMAFKYNPGMYMPYTQADDTIVYVENYNILKISPNGVIDFKTLDGGQGLDISTDTLPPNSLFEVLEQVTQWLSDVWESNEGLLRTQGSVAEASQKSYKLQFDYNYNGIPVYLYDDHNNPVHAVEMEVAGGFLKSYKQYIKIFEEGKAVRAMNTLQALDAAYEERAAGEEASSGHEMHVKNIYISYSNRITENDKETEDFKLADWTIHTALGEEIRIPVLRN